jgi:cytochrome c oxidase assembly protein subunit 15
VNARQLNAFAVFVAASTFFLIVAGALVTSTGSGLAVPDWPLSYGQYFPEMKGGVFYEHGHRMIAGTVGFLMLLLAVSIWIWEPRRSVRWVAAAAVLSVVLQAVLGGATVLYGLPPEVSIAHAMLGQTFFCLTVTLALMTSKTWAQGVAPEDARRLFPAQITATALVYAQLFFGAGVRHGAGMVFLHLHLVNAGAVAGILLAVFYTVRKKHRAASVLYRPAAVCASALLIQITLGLLAYLPMIGVESAFLLQGRTLMVTLHVAVGALILASSLAGTIWGGRLFRDIQKKETSLSHV